MEFQEAITRLLNPKNTSKLPKRKQPKNQNPNVEPPIEFLCPISGSLMHDPVIVSSGHTFERTCVEACKSLSLTTDCTSVEFDFDFSTLIPNLALKSAILDWCRNNSFDAPKPLGRVSAEKLVLVKFQNSSRKPRQEETKDLSPDVCLVNAGRESIQLSDESDRSSRYSSTSLSSSELETRNPDTNFKSLLKPPLYGEENVNPGRNSEEKKEECVVETSSGLSGLESQNLTGQEFINPDRNSEEEKQDGFTKTSSSGSSMLESRNLEMDSEEVKEEMFAEKLNSQQVFDVEEALSSLRMTTRTKEESRIKLCTPNLLTSLRPLITSRYMNIQANSVACIVNLSLHKPNKERIVRAGFIPILIDVLKGGFPDAQEHACGAIFSLALDDNNKTAIGVLGALPPLLHLLRSERELTQRDSALALYHLSLVQSNRTRLVKLGCVPSLLRMVKSRDNVTGHVVLVLCNLASCESGSVAILESGGVKYFVDSLRLREFKIGLTHESCLSVLYRLSFGDLRFGVLAKAAGAEEVMKELANCGRERSKEMAKRILQVMKEEEEE